MSTPADRNENSSMTEIIARAHQMRAEALSGAFGTAFHAFANAFHALVTAFGRVFARRRASVIRSTAH
jgi:hypothetical protein